MANSNFIVQNGLTVGPLTIFAGNGDVSTTGNISTVGGSLNPASIFSNSTNVTASANYVNVAISGSNVASFSSSGLTVANITTTGTSGNITGVNNLSANTISISGNASVGNLTVNGTTTTINSTTLDVTDINITVAKGATAAAADGGGLTIDGAGASLTWDNAATSFKVNKSFIPSANLTYNLGSTTAWWNTLYGVSTQAKYADLAENYQADKHYNPGTVLMFGGSAEVTVAEAGTKAVAGVVSTNPAHLMNGALSGPGVVALALTGRVPCMVVGPIKKGDLLVSAGFGYARADNNAGVGQVIGKALQDFPSPAKAVIEVVVGRV